MIYILFNVFNIDEGVSGRLVILTLVALEIAFNIEAQMGKMSNEEIFDKFQVRNVKPSMIADCVYKICQQLERQPSRKLILEMMPKRFKED